MLRRIIDQPSESPKDSPPKPPQVPGAERPLSSPAATVPQPQRVPTHSPSMTSTKNVLSNDVEIKGSIKFSHDLIIDGRIEGEVISDGALTVGENANIKGEIKTRTVVIFGKVEGNVVVAERCELKSNATLIGDITAGTLSIEEGATFDGRSAVGRKPEANRPAAPKPQG